MKFLSIVSVVLVILVSSCSIQKRHFNKGWNIEWNRRHTSESTASKETAKYATSDENLALATTTASIEDVTAENEPATLIRFTENEDVNDNTVAENKSFTKSIVRRIIGPKKPKLGKKYERTPAGKVAFVTGVSGISLVSAGWIMFYLEGISKELSNIGIGCLLLGFLLGLATLIFAARSRKQLEANPTKYNPDTGKKWAFITLGIAVLGMVIGSIALMFIH